MSEAALARDSTAGSSGPLVVLDGVNKWFGDLHVLQDINLAIDRGEVVVVIGPSGSGKSTLCRAINRLETIGEGKIRLDGKLLPAEGKELADLRADVGIVFQSFNLFAHQTVLDNVTLGVKYDQPGIGFLEPGPDEPSGFDIEIAKIIAAELGIAPDDITWKETVSDNREPFLQNGTVDIVLASYSITDERRNE